MKSKINSQKIHKETTELLNQKLTEAMMTALKAIHSAASPDSMDVEDLARQRKGQEVLGRLMSPPIGFSWEPLSLGKCPWHGSARSGDTTAAK